MLTIRQNFETPEENKLNYRHFIATGYCGCKKCNGKWSNGKQTLSATGEKLAEGISIAADTSVLPYYTKVNIKGMGDYIVHDCGSAIKGNRIDVYFESHSEAEDFGVQDVMLAIIQ